MARGVEGLADYKFPSWMEFGIHPATGNIDIADVNGDIIPNVPVEQANDAMGRFNSCRAMMVALGMALERIDRAKFEEIWNDPMAAWKKS